MGGEENLEPPDCGIGPRDRTGQRRITERQPWLYTGSHWRTAVEMEFVRLTFIGVGAKASIFDLIEGIHDARRRHSAIDYLSPAAHEKRHLEAA